MIESRNLVLAYNKECTGNESDVQESRGFDISWMQTIMNGLIL